ncbi:hypothetical protein KC354_g16183 [Hortaea werneckii]|nr:hypothetical protein KC354_g16183 [Hortaea werneckii]
MAVPDRSVSPVGASRFEKPFNPVVRLAGSTKSSSKDTSPTSTHNPASANMSSHHSEPSVASTMQSTTNTTAPSSVESTTTLATPTHDLPHSPPATAWFARFRSDPDLSLTASDACPDRATLAAVYDLPIHQADGTAQPFGTLFDPAYALHQRQMLIFIRHFYCGACQAYLQAISASITKSDYFRIPTPTSIFVIGCGAPDLIPVYKRITGCPFPIFADPSRQLFKKLGMRTSMNIGSKRPEYMSEISAPAWAWGQVTTVKERVRAEELRKRDILRGGNPMQIGGEFLFDEGEVVWCHRMRNYRNHAEVAVMRKVLELDE